MQKRDWAGTVLIAALIALTGFLHAHSLAVVTLILVCALCIGIVAYDVGHERGSHRAAASVGPTGTSEPKDFSELSRAAPYRSHVAAVDDALIEMERLRTEADLLLMRAPWRSSPAKPEFTKDAEAWNERVMKVVQKWPTFVPHFEAVQPMWTKIRSNSYMDVIKAKSNLLDRVIAHIKSGGR